MGIEVYNVEAAWIWQRFVGGEIAGLDTLDEFKAVFQMC